MSSKPPISQQQSSDLVAVRAVHTINEGRKSHPPGSVFEAPRKDADLLMTAGVVVLATDPTAVPIEELLPIGMDPRLWRADPRVMINGQRSAVFVLRSEFDQHVKANR
jgi:hypothetical protein